jgi:trk system potassium uptake protein TrkA
MIVKQVAVIGLGRFGSSVARTLAQQGHDVLGIDIDEARVTALSRVLTQAITVREVNEEVLLSLGVKECDAAVVGMANLEFSITISQILKDFGIKLVISKAASELHGRVLQRIGVDRVIFPERDMGIRLAHSLVTNTVIDYIELSPDYNIYELATPADFVGQSLAQTQLRATYHINVIAIKRAGNVIISPGATEVIQANDILVVIGHNNDINRFYR